MFFRTLCGLVFIYLIWNNVAIGEKKKQIAI